MSLNATIKQKRKTMNWKILTFLLLFLASYLLAEETATLGYFGAVAISSDSIRIK
jgi:hypothetical protein